MENNEIKENIDDIEIVDELPEEKDKNIKKELKKELKVEKVLKEEIEKNKKEIERLNNEIKLSNDKLIRISAEMQNVRRHAMEDRESLIKYEGSDLIKKLLPIIDNFERAIAMDTTSNDKYLEGYKMIYTNMLNILKEIGVVEIECLNKPFDPKTMEAVLTESIIEEEQGIVLDVLQKGYMYKDKLIRPAMVKVNE